MSVVFTYDTFEKKFGIKLRFTLVDKSIHYNH